jgi:hypothetical protein
MVERVGAAWRPGEEVALARAAGRLIALCGAHARPGAEAGWWWDAAIGLLDELCDVGARGRPAPRAAHVAALEASFGR